MAKSKSSRLTKKVAGRKKRKSRPIKKNPASTGLAASSSNFLSQTWSELANVAVPGVIAYGLGRTAGRIGYKLGKRKSLAVAKHTGPLASVAFAVGSSVAVSKIQYLSKWDMPIVTGAWIAALQSVVQTYMPMYGWILNDWHMDDVLPMATAEDGEADPRVASRRAATPLVGGKGVPMDAGIPASGEDDDFADIPGLNDAGMNVGIFSGGLSN
jgi:hypothetical protein